MDNTGLYYEAPFLDETCERIERELSAVVSQSMSKNSRFFGKIHPYVSRVEPALVDALSEASASLGVPARLGLTASACGFFAPQGRDVTRVKPSIPDLDRILSDYEPGLDGQRIENMEMEASFLIHFMEGLSYWAGAICAAIANRRLDTFDSNYQKSIENASKVALVALANLRRRFPDVRLG